MSDQDSVAPFQATRPEDDPDLLLYDYSKYLLTLALLVLGAVLSLRRARAGPIWKDTRSPSWWSCWR